MLGKSISPGYSLINAHLRHIAPNHNHCPISVIPTFIPEASIYQVEIIIDKESDDQLVIMQDTIESNMQYSDEKKNNPTEHLTAMIT